MKETKKELISKIEELFVTKDTQCKTNKRYCNVLGVTDYYMESSINTGIGTQIFNALHIYPNHYNLDILTEGHLKLLLVLLSNSFHRLEHMNDCVSILLKHVHTYFKDWEIYDFKFERAMCKAVKHTGEEKTIYVDILNRTVKVY